LKRQSEESNPKDNGSDGVHDFVEENTEPVKESVDPSNSDDGQEENKDKSIDTSLVKDTTEELEAAHQDVIVASNGDNGVLNVPEVDIEEVIEVTNGDGIENKTVVELVEDQLL